MKLNKLLKNPKFWLASAILGLLLLCWLTPLKVLFDQKFLEQQLQQLGNWAICLFVLVYTLATVVGVPGTVLTVAGGAVFGIIWGALWSVIGATLGAIGAFWVARYLSRDLAEKWFGRHKYLQQFNEAVRDKPLNFVLAVRFAPICPFNLVNFLFGLTPISCLDYAIGTFFGIIPGTLAYTWLGVAEGTALQEGDRFSFFLALTFLTLLSVLPVWVKRKRK
ncbi:MAG: TVP38/TMEM64 family protein [Coleofasciculaceae cyanobacterium]